jgi:hypothetical protein
MLLGCCHDRNKWRGVTFSTHGGISDLTVAHRKTSHLHLVANNRRDRMSRVAQILSAVAGIGAVAVALAQTTPAPTPTSRPVFESLDKNADGKVSLAEASTDDELFVAFRTLDKDKNGELSKEEFAVYQAKQRGAS